MILKNKEMIDKYFNDVTNKEILKCLDYLIVRYPLENIIKIIKKDNFIKEAVLDDLCEKVKNVTKL